MKLFRKEVVMSLVRKEFRQMLRNVRMRGIMFGSPLIMILVFGFAVNTDVKDIGTVVYDEDMSRTSRGYIERFSSNGWFTIRGYLSSQKEMDAVFDYGRADLYIHIPPGFEKELKTGRSVDVQFFLDGTDSNRAQTVISYGESITRAFSESYLKGSLEIIYRSRGATGVNSFPEIIVRERALFNPDLLSRNYYLPGVVALLITLISIMLTSMSVVREREEGTMDQIIVSPLRSFEYVLGKTVPFGIVAFIDIVVVTVIAIVFFRVPFNGNIIFLLFSGAIYISSMLSIGLYISTISETQQQAMLSTFIFILPSIMFSGFVFPVSSMPLPAQVVTLVNPLRYIIVIFRGVFLKGVGLAVLWKEIAAILVIAAVLTALSVRRFVRTMG